MLTIFIILLIKGRISVVDDTVLEVVASDSTEGWGVAVVVLFVVLFMVPSDGMLVVVLAGSSARDIWFVAVCVRGIV